MKDPTKNQSRKTDKDTNMTEEDWKEFIFFTFPTGMEEFSRNVYPKILEEMKKIEKLRKLLDPEELDGIEG